MISDLSRLAQALASLESHPFAEEISPKDDEFFNLESNDTRLTLIGSILTSECKISCSPFGANYGAGGSTKNLKHAKNP